MNKTSIPYLDYNWPIVTGCSYGCPECWARRMHLRFNMDFEPTFWPERLNAISRRKKPGTVGVAFTGDLFTPPSVIRAQHGNVIFDALEAARTNPQHTYVFLTKRASRMALIAAMWTEVTTQKPPANWFMGVTVRNQAELDAAAPHIRAMARADWKVWLSIEPMQGPVNIAIEVMDMICGNLALFLNGVILGGQSGPKAPSLNADWVRTVRDQCEAANVPFAYKQDWGLKPQAWPELDGKRHTALPWPLHTKAVP